jgi:2-oxoisovalerate dehydrogenase E1 component beta subunit
VHTPGLKVVAPATPADAKGLLLAAIRDDNPVIYFEAKPLYRSLKGPVPDGSEATPLGVARIARAGDDLSIVTYGSTVHDSVQAAEDVAGDGISVEVIDLRSLKPMDTDAVLESVGKTGRALVVHAANKMAGVGAEVAAFIGEEAFGDLDAPVRRLGGLDIPIPFSPPLEDAYRVGPRSIVQAIREMVAW